jgi:hypothetical protein
MMSLDSELLVKIQTEFGIPYIFYLRVSKHLQSMSVSHTKKEFSICLTTGNVDIVRDLFRIFKAENVMCVDCEPGKLHMIHHGKKNRRTHSIIDRTLKRFEVGYQEKSLDKGLLFVKIDPRFNGYAKTFDGGHLDDVHFSQIFNVNKRFCRKSGFRYDLQPGVKRYLANDFQEVLEQVDPQDSIPDDISILRQRVFEGMDLKTKLDEELKKNARMAKQLEVLQKRADQAEDGQINIIMSIKDVRERLLKIGKMAGVEEQLGDNYKIIWKRVALAVHPDKLKCTPEKAVFFEKLGKAFTQLPSNI